MTTHTDKRYTEVPMPPGICVFTCAKFPTRTKEPNDYLYLMKSSDVLVNFKEYDKARDSGDGLFSMPPDDLLMLGMSRIIEHVTTAEYNPDSQQLTGDFVILAWAIRESGEPQGFFDQLSADSSASIGLCFDEQAAQEKDEWGAAIEMSADTCTIRSDQAGNVAGLLDEWSVKARLH